jgi:titin
MPLNLKDFSPRPRSRGWRCLSHALAAVFLASGPLAAATFSVTNSADSGNGTLRKAIQDAALAGGLNTINFNLSGSAPFTINLLSALPVLDQVILDAATQPGYTGQPLVELNGTSAGSGTVGLRLNNSNVVRALAINRFSADGIRTDGASNVVQGCYIGTDTAGTMARGNGQYGIFIFGTAGNQIGGTNLNERNVISGGNDTGIYLLNPGAAGNIIQGNYIGLTASGSGGLGNRSHGITLVSAPGNLIGGPLAAARNVISGNAGSGITLNNSGATGNVIQGNYLGLTAAGTAALANLADGITLNSAPGNRLGGASPGARNVISGNAKAGLLLSGSGTAGNLIDGNFIGTDASGSNAVGNLFAGITLANTASNLIGGAAGSARNWIAGNRQDGIYATNATGLLVQGNIIGLNFSGLGVLSNWNTGITLDNSRSNSIGGDLATLGNVISGNGGIGVWLLRTNARGNLIRGNFIGTGLYGTNALGNQGGGMGFSDAPFNRVGGLAAGERNVVSGNGFPANNGGVFLSGTAATGNTFLGNYLGTDSAGQFALPNRYEGMYVVGGGSNVIGSELAGGGNLFAGNTTRGLRLTNSFGNVIAGNRFGTRLDGVTSLANGQFNLELEENSRDNALGGLLPGAGNRIAFSGGGFAGVRVRDLCTNNFILGNAIFSNSGLGIDLGTPSGVTPNDACDGDPGANQLQNFPVLQQACTGPGLGVRGYLNSRANTLFRIQFFASPACDPSGNGQGQTYLGDAWLTTGGSCSNSFVASFSSPVPVGYVITATATDPSNNTSEFSACSTVDPNPQLALAAAPGNQVALSWTNTAPGFVLKETTNLTPAVVWTAVTNLPAIVSGRFVVSLPRQPGERFYRLSFE